MKEQAMREIAEERARSLAETTQQLAELRNQLQAEHAHTHQQLLKTTEGELLDLVVAVAEEVVGEAIRLQPESLLARVRRALAHVSGPVQLIVNADDHALLGSKLAQLAPANSECAELAIQQSEDLPPGTARLITERGAIESSTTDHLHAMRQHLQSQPSLFSFTTER